MLLFFASAAGATEITGRAERIVDGDTFWLCDTTACTKIRLCGIDAPELGDPRAAASTAVLAALLRGQVTCVQVGSGTPCDGRSAPTNGDRVVAQCFAAGVDVAASLTSQGLACDWPRYSGGHYSAPGVCRR